MKGLIRVLTFFTLGTAALSPLRGDIFLNEISAGGGTDWIELKLTPDTDSMDISGLFVTMYYGTNRRIADSPVTLYSRDIPETPWDDRFAVIYFTSVQSGDETDEAGDLNNNGIREIYCDNYGLWNTDCSVSIDTDDDPANNGILDFAAFSNRDGSINTTVASYISSAIKYGMWHDSVSSNLQDCCSYIGPDGMNSWSTLSRNDAADTNSMDDFVLTPYATPGKENIINTPGVRSGILRPLKKRILYKPGPASADIELPLFIYTSASLRIRIFNSAGMSIYTGPLLTDVVPGYYTALIRHSDLKGRILTGLYPVSIEAVGSSNGRTESCAVTIIVVR